MISTSRSQQRLFNLFVFLVLCAGVVIAAAPLFYMISTAFKGSAYVQEYPPRLIPETVTLENFETAFTSRNFGRAFLNSAIVAIATSVLVTMLAATMAYSFARFEFRGKRPIYRVLLIMLMIPGVVLLIPQFILASNLGLRNSLPGLILVYSAGPLAFNTFLLRGFFENLPRELEEAAIIDGANSFTVFWRVMLPLAAPAISTVAVFSFLGAWDEYVLALNFLTDETLRTLPIAIANFRGQHSTNWGLVFAGSLTAVVPTVVLFIVFQRYFIQGITSGAVRG
ncbi:MAG: carbohydrate ABC transporter permease [Chloroflexi bacterium]|nr:carbohydrate ABC transporter permease [Chloroflexota bacterium]MCC6891755.1 carbohydrate ABC transporter permease [Anaerolineae bacterium]